MFPAEYARELSGLRKCPLMDFDVAESFLQYKKEYLEKIRHLVTEEEIKVWDNVEKGWEKYKVGQFGYFGDFTNNGNDGDVYSKGKAMELYNCGNNEKLSVNSTSIRFWKWMKRKLYVFLGH